MAWLPVCTCHSHGSPTKHGKLVVDMVLSRRGNEAVDVIESRKSGLELYSSS